MNPKTMIPLGVALVLGLVAAMSARSFMRHPAAEGPAIGNLRPVVVADRNIGPGQTLKLEDLAVAKATAEMATDAVFTEPGVLKGRVTTMPLLKGQPVVEGLLAPIGAGTGLQALVPNGMRAVTLEVNEYTGVAGFLVPGCRVDVVATVRGEDNEMSSRTVVQDIRVQAVGEHMPDTDISPSEQIKSVTLIGTPREVEAIDLAAATGRVRLVLRGGNDSHVQSVDGVSVAELRGNKSVPASMAMIPTTRPAGEPIQPVQAHVRTVQVIRAGVESIVNMPEPQGPTVTQSPENYTN
jgi:pilus assembly protein CpaB